MGEGVVELKSEFLLKSFIITFHDAFTQLEGQ